MGKKRSHGEGTVRRLKSGNWHGEVMDGYSADGKKRIISFTAATKAEVLDKIRDYRNKKDAHIRVNKKLELSSWADLWYRDYQSQVQASTYSGYQYTLKIIKERMGPQIVCDILPIDINRFMDSLIESGYSLSQIRKCRTMLIQIFDSAEANGIVAGNPARKAKIIRDKDGTLSKPRYEKDAFRDDEIELLQKELPHDLTGYSIRVMLDSGLRVQELLALAPTDIAADGSAIHVGHAIKMVGSHPVLGPPKSKSGIRTIPIPENARDSAKYLREHGGKTLIWSIPGHNPYYSVGSFRRRYYTAIGQVEGVRKLSPHCCRHTYITRLQAKGVPLELIARLAGHSSIVTTNDYAHTSMDTLVNAVSVLN
mgnify:CR=1 FL=1